MDVCNLSFPSIFEVSARFNQLGKCSNCKSYNKCRGIKLLCYNPNDNPNNPRKNPDNPIKEKLK